MASDTVENASLNVGIGKKKKDKNDKNLIDPKQAKAGDTSSNAAKVCRICLGEDEEETDNPLIEPCKCSGTMSSIHIACL